MVTTATPSSEALTQNPSEPPVSTSESAPVVVATPEAPVATPAPVAPVATSEPTPVTPVPATQPLTANLPPEVQEYVTRLEQQAQTAREQGELQQLNQTVSQYAAQLEQQHGLTPEQAQFIAKTQGDILYKQFNSERNIRAQFRAAVAFGKQFGVDPMQLMDLSTPEAMRQTAQTLSATTKQSQEIAELRAQVAKLTKGAVPAQTFAQGAQPGAGAGLQGDALEAAWLKHEIEQSDKPNPYDSAYRAMLGRR